MKANVIIQARMLSSRLPQKVLKKVVGKPLIGHMIERLKLCENVEEIIIATSIDPSNDPLVDYLHSISVKVFRGDEDDVLKRVYLTAIEHKAKAFVRLTADCPLTDPYQVDDFIQKFYERNADYVFGGSTFAEGLDIEIFKFELLEEAHKQATKKSEREHVTQYFHNNKEKFNIIRIDNDVDDSHIRITVDEKEDFVVVSKIFEALYSEDNKIFRMNEIRDFLDKNPEVFKLNSAIIRNEGLLKSLKEEQEGKSSNS